MTKESFEKAKELFEKEARAQHIIDVVEKPIQSNLDERTDEKSDFVLRREGERINGKPIELTYGELAVIKKAFEDERHKLNREIAML